MDYSFTITPLTLLLLLQGVGSLFLALTLGVLYGYRRQPTLLYWALAWMANGLWLLLGSINFHLASSNGLPVAGKEAWLQHMAVMCGWLHAALWLLSMQHFRADAGRDRSAAAPGVPLPLAHAAVLLVVGLAALVFSRSMSLAVRNAWLGFVLAAVYAWSALVLVRCGRQGHRFAAVLLVVVLLVAAADRLHYGFFFLFHRLIERPLVGYVSYTALVDCIVQFVTAAALLVFLLDTEQNDLREAIERLEESEERFRLIFEHSGVGMSLLTGDGRFIQVNPALVRMLGYSAEELRGQRLADLAYRADQTVETPNTLLASSETPSLYEREKRYQRKDGESIWARVVRVPIRDSGGRALHYVGVLVDITERKRIEEALAASEQRYRLLNQVAHDGIYVTGEADEFLDVNPAFCQILGRSREELLGLTLEQLAADAESIRGHRLRVVQRGGDRLETRLLRRDGRAVDVELSGARLDLEGRRLLHGICRDDSERKRAEAEVREARERLREERDFSKQVLDTANVLICVVEAHGRIVRFNATCAAVSGFSEEEVRGRPFWHLLAERDAEAVRVEHVAVVGQETPAAGRPAVVERCWRARSGDERLISWRASTVCDAQGQVRYVIHTGIDMTEQRQLEERLRQARKLETLGTLVGGIAHDFNNQLTAILGHLSMVLGDLKEIEERGSGFEVRPLREPLTHAELAAQRCADITQRLLTFSSGRVGPTSLVSVDGLLAETARALQHELPATIRIHVVDQQLAAGGGPATWSVAGDSTQLEQVLLSLAANARDAMPFGGTLTLSAVNRVLREADCALNVEARPGRFVELAISDTGNGMTPEVQARLFEPFFTTKKMGQGAGMGLAMAYGIVKAHKGWITVDSVPGEGSTFRLYLPATGESISCARIEDKSGSGGAPEGGRECILVVDDEDLVRTLAEAVLQRWGYRVLTACDGEEALEVYRRHAAEIDLVLLDYSMPKLTGLQVFQEMQKLDPNLCVIFSSGYTMDKDSDQLLVAGARAFIPKPYRPDDLIRTVRQVLDNHPGRRTSSTAPTANKQ